MAQLRSVNTKFWEDPWVESLGVSEKLLFIYLLTNPHANLAGIYEVSIKRICFETGLDKKTVSNVLKSFERVGKVFYIDETFIFLPNWLKNQSLNSNMKKGVVKIFSELPKQVKINVLGNDYQTLLKDYQTLRNTLLKYEGEIEYEEKEEREDEDSKKPPKRFTPPTLDEVKAYCKERNNNVDPERWFDFYESKGWMVGKNNMKNWKAAVRTWEKSDNKNNQKESIKEAFRRTSYNPRI